MRAIFAGEIAGSEFVGVDLGYGGDEALEAGTPWPFRAEDCDVLAAEYCRVFLHARIEIYARFFLARARGEDQQLGGLQAGVPLFQLDVAGVDPVDAFALPSRKIFSSARELSDDSLTGDDAWRGCGLGEVEM